MPPQPTDAFEWVQAPAGPQLVCRPLERVAPHFFTTRSWLLGRAPADTDARWEEVARAAGVGAGRLLRLKQVHGATVAVHRQGHRPAADDPEAVRPPSSGVRPEADIVISDDADLAVAVQTADCVPVLIADARTGAVAAAHAGWRGLAARVASVTVEALEREFGSRPADLVAAVGPSIGACCYEVGEEVRARFEHAGFLAGELARWFLCETRASLQNRSMPGVTTRARAAHWYFDAWRATCDQLESAGARASEIHVATLCTASHPDVFCSYRRDGPGAGRLAAVVRARRPAKDPVRRS